VFDNCRLDNRGTGSGAYPLYITGTGAYIFRNCDIYQSGGNAEAIWLAADNTVCKFERCAIRRSGGGQVIKASADYVVNFVDCKYEGTLDADLYGQISEPRRLIGWVTHDNASGTPDGIPLGTIPAGCYVSEIHLYITEEFDAGGNDDALSIGYDGTPEAFMTSLNINGDTGIQDTSANRGAQFYYEPTSRACEVYYTYTGGAPTQGEALVIVEYIIVPVNP